MSTLHHDVATPARTRHAVWSVLGCRRAPESESRAGWRLTLGLAAALLPGAVVESHTPHDPVGAVAVSPNYARDRTVFVATGPETHYRYDDVLKSTDGGATWAKVPAGLENRTAISSLSISPHYATDGAVIATTNGDGVFEYREDRASWKPLNTGLPDLRVTESRSVTSPGGGTVVFVALKTGGLYLNERDRGEDAPWVLALSRTVRVSAMAVSPGFSQDTTLAVADAAGRLWISTDGGTTWSDHGRPTGAAIHGIAIAPDYPSRGELFLTAGLPGVFRSRDFGRSFSAVHTGLPAVGLSAIATSPHYLADATVLCTSVEKAVYRSTDGGDTWLLHESGAKDTNQAPGIEMKALVFASGDAPEPAVFLVAYDGLFRSVDGGRQWVELQTRRNVVNGIGISPGYAMDGTVVASVYGGKGLHATSDRGASWSPAAAAIIGARDHLYLMDIAFLPALAGTPGWVVSQNHYAMWTSEDRGSTWRRLPLPNLTDLSPYATSAMEIAVSPDYRRDGTLLVATRDHGVLRTTDYGATWSGAPVMASVPVTSVVVSPQFGADGIALAGTKEGRIWRTADSGRSWSPVGSTGAHRGNSFVVLAISPDFARDGLALAGTSNGLFVSRDRGLSWRLSTVEAVGVGRIVDQVRYSPNYARDRTIFVSVRGRGLYRSVSGGSSFKQVGVKLFASRVQFAEFQLSPEFELDRTLFGASRHDVYRSLDAGVSWQQVARLPE